jgi:tetratricopeptide (TPR) repeat protein
MARQTQTNPRLKHIYTGRLCRILPASLVIVFLLADASPLKADSLASQNKRGNRLFAQGRYQEAENAYLDAEVNHPGRPEILYNLGNSLIKQKKYDKGLQTLRQSIDKGEKETKEHSWYNAGDAYFLVGDYKNSCDAFIQALKLNPADKDAKHNLELALMKLKQQQQSKPDQSNRNSENPKQNPRSMDKRNQANSGNQNQNRGGDQKEQNQNRSREGQSARDSRSAGSITKEQALQILDALKNQELQDQRMLFEHRVTQRPKTKDW